MHSKTMDASEASRRRMQLSRLRKIRKCQQVAAVCYRIRGRVIEFLLVQTRGSRRWTFPKGSAEPGLTHAQAAAIEAFEEAGVHGRIEESAFTEYICRRGSDPRPSNEKGFPVSAHLCEVRRLCAPKEANRNRTWFSVAEAKRRLCEGRGREDGAEFARVVDKASRRIQSLLSERTTFQTRQQTVPARDEWSRVRLEARVQNAAWVGNPALRRFDSIQRLAGCSVDTGEESDCGVLPFGRLRQVSQGPKLLSGAKKFKVLTAGTRIQ